MNEPEIELPQAFCRWCDETKAACLFTPTELTRKHPKCRACMADKERKNVARPGAKPGYAWRAPFFPEKVKGAGA